MPDKYKTVLSEAQAEIIEKKSRFIASVMPVSSEDDARLFIDKIKKKYWDATHNVFAYQVGERNEIQRQSDDGEPSGTAGLPVLDVLRGEDIKNTAVVVTRYFGGTLLGTGGLVRAYGRCAKEGVLAAEIIEKILYQYVYIKTDYSDSGKIEYEIHQSENIILDTQYTDTVYYTVVSESHKASALVKRITDITNGKAEITQGSFSYGFWIDGTLEMDI